MSKDLSLYPEIVEMIKKIPGFMSMSAHQQEFLKCKASFKYFSSNYLWILHTTKGLVPFELFPYQERCVSDFVNHRFNIISKFRQGGLSTLAVLWSLWRCMFMNHQTILVLSKTDREATAAGEIAERALQNMQFKAPWLVPELSENNKHTVVFAKTGSRMMFHSPEAARGKAARIVIIDEAAFIDGMEDHWKAMYPVISTGGSVIVISTVNGRGNWYERQYSDAMNGKNQFHVIDLDYTEHPDYRNPEWIKTARANMSEKAFAQEYERSFIGSGETYLKSSLLAELGNYVKDQEPIRKLYPEWDSDGMLAESEWDKSDTVDWNRGALHVYKEPSENKEYIIGVDVAEGVGDDGDNSTFQIIDINSLEQVAEFSSNTVPPNTFASILAVVGNYYNIATIVVETTGPGHTVLDKLQNTLYYENIYCTQVRSKEKAGIINNKTTRPLILEAMQNYLQNKYVKVKSKRLVRELDTFIFNRSTKRAEAMRMYHDDLIMAFSIALYVRDQTIRDVPLGSPLPDNIVDSIKTELFESIKKEIERGAPEEFILDERNELHDVTPGVIFDFRRPNDGLLREFGF